MWISRRRKGSRRTEDATPILQNNNTIMNGLDPAVSAYDNPRMQNSLNAVQSRSQIDPWDLAEFLGVSPDDVLEGPDPSADGSCDDTGPLLDSGDLEPTNRCHQGSIRLMRASVRKHFPQLPAREELNLERHLSAVQETVVRQTVRLAPMLRANRQLGHLIDCYHRHTCNHLHVLLQHANNTQKAFVLMEWALQTYLSPELLGHPDLQDRDPMKPVDLLLLIDWVPKAQDKLLENVQRDISRALKNILTNERDGDERDDEEAYVRLHVDVIQCINAVLKRAQEISPTLMGRVRKVCFQELQKFVNRYTGFQRKILETQVKMAKPRVIHFFKTLNTCKELKVYVQTKDKGIRNDVQVETIMALESMEGFTQKLLLGKLNEIAESHLKSYFKTDNKQVFILISTIKELFHWPYRLEIQKGVIDKAYQQVSYVYTKHLVQNNRKKLRRRWNDDVGRRVTQDANQLHLTFSELSRDVRSWNLMLLSVKEMLECKSIDGLRLTVGSMLQDYSTASCHVDPELLHDLLRWMGHSKWEVRQVLDACMPEDQPRPAAWCSCFPCC